MGWRVLQHGCCRRRLALVLCLASLAALASTAFGAFSVSHDGGATNVAEAYFEDADNNKYLLVGAVVTYTVNITNEDADNNVTYTDLAVQADGTPKTLACPDGVSSASLELLPEGSVACNFTMEVTTADIEAGSLSDLHVEVLNSTESQANVTLSRAGVRLYKVELLLLFDSSNCGLPPSLPGERINCTDLVLLNNGTVALTDVRFNSTGHASDCDVNMNANMSAGANITCNFTQTAALSDFEANQTMYIAASAAGTAPNGSAVFATLGPVDISLPLHQEVTWSFTLLDAPNPVTSVGDTAAFQLVLENTGNVKWNATDAPDFSPSLDDIICETTQPALHADPASGNFSADHTLLVGHRVQCNGSFTFTPNVFETLMGVSPKPFTAFLPFSRPADWTYKAQTSGQNATQLSVNVAVTAISRIQVVFGNCSTPTNATNGVPVSCPVNITNTGNVGLSALNVTSAAPNGTVLTCTNTSALSPYGMRGCQLSRTVSQDDFDAGSIQLSADYFTATPAGSPLTLQISGSTLTLSLDQRPSLSLQVQLGPAVTRGDAKVMADITVSNTGNTRISNITLSSSNWTNITCACSASENITQLVPGESQQCTANITFTQDLFEAVAVGASSGRLATQLTAAAAGSPSVGNITALLDVMTQYAASVEVNIDSCTVPDAPGNISCEVSVVNTGSVRIEHVTVHGPDSSCAIPGKIQPGQNISAQCVVHKAVTQALFDAREANEGSTSTQLSLAVNVSAQSSVPDMAVISSVPADTFDGLSLPVHRNMTVTTSVDKTVIDLTGQSVTQTVLIHNTGNVQLRDVNLTTTLSTATGAQAAALPAYSCQLDGGPSALTLPAALPQGSNLTCVTTYHFSNVQQIEAGDLHFDTMASAAALSEFIILPTKVVAVPGLPKFNMTLDAQACEAAQPSPNFAGSTITCPNALKLTVEGSNVRVAIANLTLADATLADCTSAVAAGQAWMLSPTGTAAITCSIVSRALQQSDFEAGYVTWAVTAHNVSAYGNSSGVDGSYEVGFNKTLVQEPRYQLGIKRIAYDAENSSSTTAAIVTAGTPVRLQVVLVNLGNTILRSLNVSVPEVTDLTCKSGSISINDTAVAGSFATGDDAPPASKLVCVGSYIFSQAELDKNQDQKVFTPAVNMTSIATKDNSALPVNGYQGDATIPINSAASVVIDVNASGCIIPSIIPVDADNVTVSCPMKLRNTGQLTLINASAITSNSSSSTDCNTTASLAPEEVVFCTLTVTTTQDDYDVGKLRLSVAVQAGHLGWAARPLDGTKSYGSYISLNNSASMDVVVEASGAVAAAGAPVSYIITARNTGAVRLKNLSLLVPPWASVTNCTPSGTVPGSWTIWPHRALVCHAEYNVTQDFYEAGPLIFVASAKPNELNTSVVSAPAVITPTYTASLLSQESACSLPSAASGDIMCPLGVTNTGTVRLRGVSIQGPQNNCTGSGMMYPGQTLNCTLHRTVNQTDYDAREADMTSNTELSVAASTFGASNVTWTTLNTSLPTPLFSQLSLPIDRNMTATATLSRSVVNATGQSVTQTVLIHNTGNVRLRDVNITTILSTAQGAQAAALTAYSCHLDEGASALSVPAAVPRGSSLSCVPTYSFSTVEHIEAGDLRFDTLVSAADAPPILSNMTVAVPSLPKFNVSLDAQACTDALPVPDNFAGSTITCPQAFKVTVQGGNVRVVIANITLTGGASLVNCTPGFPLPPLATNSTFDPTNQSGPVAITCSVVSPQLTQDDYEAGSLPWGVIVEGVVAKGDSAAIDGDYTVNFTRTLQRVRKYQLAIKRTPLNASDAATAIVYAGTPINLQVQLINLGNTILRSLNVSVPEVTDLTCKSGSISINDTAVAGSFTTGDDVPPASKLVCVGSYTFSQAELDKNQDQKVFTPAVNMTSIATKDNSALPVNGYQGDATIPINSAASVVIDVNASGCIIPSIIPVDADNVTVSCPMKLRNTGQLTLINASAITSNSSSSTDCNTTASLAPEEMVFCTLTVTTTQDDYDVGKLRLSVAVQAGHLGWAARPLDGTKSYGSYISLNNSASMDVVVEASGTVAAAGAPVSYIITARNTGAVRLKNLSLLVPPWASVTNCTPSGTMPGPWTIWPHRALVCHAEYNVTQDFYEAGPLIFVASAKPNELNTSVVSAPAVITPTYTASLEVKNGNCTYPLAPGNIMCAVEVANTGTVRLREVQVQGPENNCSTIDTIWPKQNVSTCFVRLSVNQTDFDTQEASPGATLGFTIEAVGRSNITFNTTAAVLTVPSPATQFTALRLPIFRNISVTASLGTTVVNRIGAVVLHNVMIHNTGNVNLRDVIISTVLSRGAQGLSSYNCTRAGANITLPNTLPVASSLNCTASYTFATVQDIEAGDLSFASTVTTADVANPFVAVPANETVTVLSQPRVQLDLNSTACDAPSTAGGTMTCVDALVFSNTGNVRVSFVNVTSTTNASASACTVADLMPGGVYTCSFTQPMSQAFLEAGVATTTLVTNGISARGQVTLLPTVLTRTITPPITQIKTMDYTLERTDAQGNVTTNGTIISLKAKLVNTGNVRLRQTTWNTEWATPASAWSNCTVGVINATDPAAAVSTVDVAVGQELICTGEFNMTQSVMEEGHIKQLAASVGVTVTDAVSSLQSSRLVIAVPVEIYPELTVDVLDTDCIKPFRAGANATCPVVLRNPGNMRVANVSVIGDSNNCSKSLMHPNETFHCFMSKQLVQYDYEQKFFVLSATNISGAAYGPMPLRTDAVLVADLAFPSLTPVYNMTLSLTVNRSEVHRVGDTVLYTMMAVNEGNVILHAIVPTANTLYGLTSALTCSPNGTLQVAAVMTCTGTFTFNQSVFEAGTRNYSAAFDSANLTVAAASNMVSTTPIEAPSVSVAIKLDTCVTPSDAGGITNCTLRLVNTGNVGLQNITVPDQGSGCPMVSYLAPGADHNCTMSRAVSQPDFDDWDTNGTRLFLQASVTALPTGVVATAQVSNSINGTIPLLSRPSLIKVSAVVSPNSIWHPGTPVTHDFVIMNDGNVALRQLGVSGLSLSSVNCSRGNPATAAVTNPVARLAVNEHLSCTGTFLFTEAEVEKGNAAHTTQAVAANVVPSTNVAFTQGIQLASVTVPNDPTLEAYVHTATCSMPQIEPDNVTCAVEVKNVGNVRLANVSIAGDVNCSMPAGALLSADSSLNCTIVRKTVQDNFEAGYVELRIAGSAAPNGVNNSLAMLRPVTAANRTITQNPSMEVIISSSLPSVSLAGTNVSFVVTAINKGNLILRDSGLNSSELGPLHCTQPVDIPVRGSLQCTAQSNFDQDDMENGNQDFNAVGSSRTLLSGNVSATTVRVQVQETPQLVVDVVAAECTKPPRIPGNATCRVELRNTGNTRLANISVNGDVNDCNFALLWPAEAVNCSMTRALEQLEFEAGQTSIMATAVAAAPLGLVKTLAFPPSDNATVVLLNQTAALDVSLVSDKGFVTAAGNVLTYTITATNIGTLKLSNVSFSIPTVSDLACTYGPSNVVLDSSVVLQLDAVVTCTGTYTFTQDDIENPPKVVAARAASTTVKGALISGSNDVTVVPLNAPAMSVDIKTADCVKPSRAPEILTCPVLVTNPGNVRLANVSIRGQPSCSAAVVEPAGQYTCNTTLVSTQAHFEAAQMTVTFVVDAAPRGDNQSLAPADITDTDTVQLATLRILSIASSSQPITVTHAGSSVNYTFIISNPGNVMVRNVTIVAPGVGPLTCNGTAPAGIPPIHNMSVDEQVVCRGTFTFDQPTIELGDKTVAAAVTGLTLTEAAVVPPVVVTVPHNPTLAIAVINTSCSIPTAAGNVVTCSMALINTGNVRLTNITVGGDAVNCSVSSPALLSPGVNVTCTLRRLLTQDDFELGAVQLTFPLNAKALGTVSALQAPLPMAAYTVQLPQLPKLELLTSVSPNFVTWPGDRVTYAVQLVNTGNVHLKSVDALPRTNSSATGMNTTFPMECGTGVNVTLPTLILVGTNLTCTRSIEFTTPVIRAGNMTVRINGSASKLPAMAQGLPRVVMTPTCENRSTPIPAGNCLNVSQHCPNDVDYLCDKTDVSRRWCTCWGGVTECVTLGVCKFTPCKTCQVCLSWAALHTPQLLNSSNPGLVAAEVNTRCKGWGKTSTACQTAADAVALSEAGNSGKRGGLLCSLLNECVNPAGFEPTCNLGNATTVPGSSPAVPYVPRGNLSLCTVQGTNTGRIIPGGLVVPPNTFLALGTCRVTADCNNTDLMCTSVTTTRRCVCNPSTGTDDCEQLGSCGPTPCAICRRCIMAMQDVATAQQGVTNSTVVALAFRAACVAGGRSLEACSLVANQIDSTYQGSMGKRPALVCRELSECPAYLDSSCVLFPNTTVEQPAITAANLDTCSLSGLVNGSLVPGFYDSQAPAPSGSCTASQACVGDGFRCSYAAAARFCKCSAGVDTCIPLGECFETSCAICQDCLTKANTFVASQLQVQDPAAVAASWATFCKTQLPRATAADCQLAQAAIAASSFGNLGKRAATLCSWVKACSPDPTCQLNALVGKVPYAAGIDLCSVEGVGGGSRVPGVQLTDTLPQGACREDMHCGSDRLMCNITTTTGAVCICDPVSGSDTCNKYYSCERTPCARCSDCLSQVSVFTSGQLYNQDSASLAAAFSTFCNRTGTWSSLQCTAAAQAVSANKPSFGKRAGNLCQALGVCGAPGAPALPISCLLSVSVAATADRAAVQLAPATLDVCAVEGVVTGSDVPGTTRQLVLPTGTCDSNDDCTVKDTETMCTKSQQTSLCTCSQGLETCRIIGGCVDTPCKSCKRCLQDFSPFVKNTQTMALTDKNQLAAAFGTFCSSTKRSAGVCESARLALSSSFRGNAARRAGAICVLLSECNTTTVRECSLSDGTLTGSLSLCTSEGISGGSPLAGYPINNITKPAGTCSVDSDCNTAGGQFCNRQVTTSSCACAASTGQDTCTALGACELTPCSRCQRCIDGMQSAVQTQLLDSSKPPVSVIASRFTQTCENLASTAGYAITACSFISNAYILPSGSSGYFGLRPGALCSSLGQCASLPADCRLRTSAAPPLVNVTGNLDMCSAEGIAGGSPLRDVVVVADPPGLCLNDTICSAANGQCDTMNKTTVLRCSGGIDSSSTYGRCVPKPPPPPVVTPCERCLRCLTTVQTPVSAAVANASAAPAALADSFYTWCSSRGYALSSCRAVQTAISSSMRGNLARRAGALCQRLQECPATIASDTSCGLSVSGVGPNATSPVTGRLDMCSVEGVSGGSQVSGLAVPKNTCVLDSDCSADRLCSSDITASVCRCMGGLDGCDELSTCQPKPAPPPPPSPAVVLTPCQTCQQCIISMQDFVTKQRFSKDAAAQAAAFVSSCTTSFLPGNVLRCREIGQAIAFSLEGNLAKRAGALCARLNSCTQQLLSAPAGSCSISLPDQAIGPVDLCTVEGVAGSSTITPSSSALSAGTCMSDKDCTTAGQTICSLAQPTTRCTCSGGNDTCVQLGQCVDFCSTRQAAIIEANALINDCDPASAASQCPSGLECKATTACKKLACDSNGVQAKQCFGLCMPAERNMVAAQLSDDGKEISVALNAPAAAESFACLSALDATRIGPDAWCTVSGRELTIRLGKGSLLVPQQDSLELLPGQTALFDVLDPAARFTGSRVVAMCSNCQPPEAAITGPSLVPEPCNPATASDITFDASFSRDRSGRALTKYQWSQIDSNDVILAGAISTANAANGGAGSVRLTLAAADLANMANKQYELQVLVVNYLGASSTASAKFDKVSAGQAPVISVAGGTEQTFKISEGIKLTAQLQATSVCAGKKVEYKWESLDTPVWSAIPADYKRKDLVVRPPLSGVSAGDVKKIRLTASFRDSDSKASVDVVLTAEGSPLQAQLKGPSGSVRGDRTLVLNAAGSVDPDDPTGNTPMTVAWECIRADYPAPCFAGTDYGEQSGLGWKLKATLLTANIQHTFKVTVSKGGRSASAALSLTPLPTASKVPTGRIIRQCSGSTCPKRHNADTALALTLAPDSGFEAATVTWRSDQLAGTDLGSAADLSVPAAKLPAAGALVVNAVLKLPSGETGNTQLTIPVNGKPSCSSSKCLLVNTVSDVFPGATYALEAAGFVDDEDGLRYEFGKVTVEGRRDVMSSGKAPMATLTGLSLTTAAVYVCAVDADGAKVCEDAAVSIKEPPKDFKVTDALTSFDVGQLSGAGDISVMAAGAQALSSLSAFAKSSSATDAQAQEEAKQVETAIAAKTGAMINSLASSAGNLIDDPATMSQVVAAVATLSKATQQLSSDAKQKMLGVVDTGITCAKVNKQQITPEEASRMWSVVASGNGMKKASSNAAGSGTGRHLLAQPQNQQLQTRSTLVKLHGTETQRHNSSSSTTTYWDGSNGSRYQLFGPPSRLLLQSTEYVAPAFLSSAQEITTLLASAASPGSGFLSGGEGGLYISVANQLGRSYAAGTGVAVGPVLTGTGGAADVASASNAVVSFSKALTSSCVAEDGSVDANTKCSDVVVPVTLTYVSDSSPLLSSTASRAAGATALPADFTVVSGALIIQASGSSTGALPCDSCVARLTIPISEAASSKYSYVCAHVISGQVYLDAAVVSSAGVRASTPGSGPVVECSVNQAGTYLVGRVLAPAQPGSPSQGVSTPGDQGQAGQQAAGANVPAIVGGVVGGVMGAVLLAGVAVVVMKRRRRSGLEPRAVAVAPQREFDSFQGPAVDRNAEDNFSVALPAAADEEGGGMTALQWAALRDEARRSLESARASQAGNRPSSHQASAVAVRPSGDRYRPSSHQGAGADMQGRRSGEAQDPSGAAGVEGASVEGAVEGSEVAAGPQQRQSESAREPSRLSQEAGPRASHDSIRNAWGE